MTSTVNSTGNNASVLNSINTANSTSQTKQSTTSTATSQASLTSNLNTFLTMLTVQLKNQDPLSPMDSTQFTNQLVQYSQVEQQININSNLGTLISMQKSSTQATAIGYIGQTVSTTGSDLPLQSGVSAFSYTLPSTATKLSVTIQDSSGKTVATLASPDLSSGTHLVKWDGKDSSGNQLSDGAYKIAVSATDASGSSITASTTTYGVVTGVTADGTNGTQLQLGAVTTPLANVQSILPGDALTSGSSSSSSSSSGTTG